MNAFDVRIHTIRRSKNKRRPFEVRWRVAGRDKSKSFLTRALADSYRAELVRAARQGLEFDPATGEPRWAVPEPAVTTWLEHAVAYADMKWPRLAPHSRASLADALATVTVALTGPASGAAAGPRVTRRTVPARLQPDPARYRHGSGRGTGARVAGAGLAARRPAQRPAGHPGRARCAHAAAGWQPRRSEHHCPQAGSVPRRCRLRRRAWPLSELSPRLVRRIELRTGGAGQGARRAGCPRAGRRDRRGTAGRGRAAALPIVRNLADACPRAVRGQVDGGTPPGSVTSARGRRRQGGGGNRPPCRGRRAPGGCGASDRGRCSPGHLPGHFRPSGGWPARTATDAVRKPADLPEHTDGPLSQVLAALPTAAGRHRGGVRYAGR